MASAFNLTAQLNLRGPTNINNIVSDIRRQLGTINGNINFNVNAATTRNITQLNAVINTLNQSLNQTTTAANNAANAIAAFANAANRGNLNNVTNNINNAGAATNNLAQNATRATRQITETRTEMEEFGRQSALAIRRFAAFSLATGGVVALTNAVKKGVAAFIEYDKELVKLQQVTGESADGLSRLSTTITSLATGLGVASGDLIKVSSTLAQAGLSARDTERALKALALSALAPSFDDLNKTVEGSIALMRQFGISAKDLESSLGSVNAVAAKFAVEASDIIAAVQRTGGVFAAASKGVSEGKNALNEFIAVFTSVRATTRESAETIATGLRTIFTRIQRGGTIEALKEFGVTLTDAEGKFVGAYKAVQLLSEGLNRIDPRDIKFSQIVEELGGFRQIGKVIPLIQQFATAQEALKVAQQGSGSLASDAVKAQLSLANQVSKVREEFLALFREIGASDTFQTIAKGALQVASALIKVADSVKGVLPVLGIMLAMRGASGIYQFGTGFAGGLRRGGPGAGRRAANGGAIRSFKTGGAVDVPVALMPGEAVIYPEAVSRIGASKLRKMNQADRSSRRKYARGGVAQVPGSGRSDSFYTTLPEGSFVLRKDATSYLGMDNIASMANGRQKFARGTSRPIKGMQRSHIGPQVPLTKKEAALLRQSGYAQAFSDIAFRQIDFKPRLPTEWNQILRGKPTGGKSSLSRKEMVEFIKSSSAADLFGGGGIPSVLYKQLQQSGKLDGLKSALLKGIGSAPGTIKSDRDLDKILSRNIKPYLKSIQIDKDRSAWDELSERQTLSVPRKDFETLSARGVRKQSIRTTTGLRKSVARRLGSYAAGGLIQHFKQGSMKPLQSMGRTDLLKEASILGVDVPMQLRALLDPRAKGSAEARAKLIKDLEDKRLIVKAKQEKTSARAQKRNIAVIGLTGTSGSEEISTPGIRGKKGARTLPGVPATLQTGALPPDVATKVQAIIRNRSERLVGAVAKIISEAAGTQPIQDRKTIRNILSKQLPNLSGLLFESGVAAAGAPYDPKSKAIDFNKGLGKQLAGLFGIDPKALTDATNDATLEQARKKVAKGQFDRGRRDKLRAKRLGRASGGEVPILAQEGEYVINKRSAQAIGYSNLNRLNKYHSGGQVQRFASGTTSGIRPRGDVPFNTFAAPNMTLLVRSLTNFGGFLDKLTLGGLSKLGDAADGLYARMRGTTSDLSIYNNQVDRLNRLSPGFADALEANRKANNRSVIGQRELVDSLYKQVSASGTLARMSGQAPAPARVSTAQTQMAAIQQNTSALAPAPPSPASMSLGAGSTQMRQRARQLRAQGLRGRDLRSAVTGSGRMSNAAMGLGFAIPMITDAMTVSQPRSEAQAAQNARMQGIGTAVGGAAMLASMGPAGMAAAVPLAVGGIIKSFADAENAAQDFAKNTQSTKLEDALEKSSSALDEYTKNVKDATVTDKARSAVLKANAEAQKLSTMTNTPRQSMVGMIAEGFGVVPKDNMQTQRSAVLENKGILSYLGTLGEGGASTAAIEFRSLIPDMAKENARVFQGASEASAQFLANQFKSGQSIDTLSASGDLERFGKSLALADVKVQEQLLAIDNTISLTDAQKSAMKQNIIATQTEAKARDIQTRALREKALENLNKQTIQLQNSLERMFQNMEQSIGANSHALSKLSDSAELASASLSGSARAGAVRLDSMNVLQNPRAYSGRQRDAAISQAAGMFGSQAPEMRGVLQLGGVLEDTLMATINSTIKAANASPGGTTQEAIGAKLTTSINQVLTDLKLPPELSVGLAKEINTAIGKIRASGEDQVDFTDLINQVPQLSSVLESSRRAQEVALKALEHWQQGLNEYTAAMNSSVDAQIEINSRLRRSSDIVIAGQIELGKALGRNISLETTRAVALQKTATQTGGATAPRDIFNNIRDTEQLRRSQEAQAQAAAQQGPAGKDQFIAMQQNLANTNTVLRENYDALKQMADSTDIASAALEKISEIRAKTQAGVGIAERLVTSSPQELQDLNRSMALLNNNMQGMSNMGTTAEDRKGALDVFNMISPLLGDRQDALKANVLESMLKESGLGVNAMMQNVLNSLRNPQADPEMQKAISIYQEGVNNQAKANEFLAQLTQAAQQNTADVAAQKLTTALQGVRLNFESQTLSDINNGIQQLVGLVKARGAAAGGAAPGVLAKGGMVYAAAGEYINFEPKGTDTVPAMLTPGEFVVNRQATQKHLPLLQSINKQKGGSISYYARGGLVFGDGWGLDKNQNAQDQIDRGGDLVSEKTLTPLNWRKLLADKGAFPVNNKLRTVSNLPYYAGTDTSQALLTESIDNKNGKLDGLKWFAGEYLKNFTLNMFTGGGRGASFDITPGPSNTPSPLDPLSIPDSNWINEIKDRAENFQFRKNQKDNILQTIDWTLRNLPDIGTIDSKKININGKDIFTELQSITDSPNASYSLSAWKGGSKRGWKAAAKFTGLSKNDKNTYLVADINRYFQSLRGVKSGGTLGKPVAAAVSTSSVFDADALQVGTGEASNLGSRGAEALLGYNATETFKIYDPLWYPMDTNIFSDTGAIESIRKISQLKADLLASKDVINNTKFTEAEIDTQRKALINKLNNLVEGFAFRQTFNADEIWGGVPTTLYNIGLNDWKNLVPKFNSDQNTFAKADLADFIPIELFDPATGASTVLKRFPWIKQGFKDTDIVERFREQVMEAIKVTPKTYTSRDGSVQFLYNSIQGPLWDDRLGRFKKDIAAFNTIDNFDGDLNPFGGLELGANKAILGGTVFDPTDINGFVNKIMTSYAGNQPFDLITALRKDPMDLANFDYGINTKNNAFYSLFGGNMQFDPVKFRAFRDAKQKQKQDEQQAQMAGQAVIGNAVDAKNFNSGKRVALARLVYKAAQKLNIPLRGRPPETFEQLAAWSSGMQGTIRNLPSDYLRTLALGTSEIYKQLANPNEDGGFFMQRGIDVNSFAGPLTKRMRIGNLTTQKVYDYKQSNISIDSLVELIKGMGVRNRLMMGGGAAAGGAGGELGGEIGAAQLLDNPELKLEGAKIVKVDPKTGQLTEQKLNEVNAIKTFQDLYDKAFNPYNQFASADTRLNFFNLLYEKIASSTIPNTRRPAFDRRLMKTIKDKLSYVASWYNQYQDQYLNTSIQDPNSIKSEVIRKQKEVDQARDITEPSHQFFTNNEFGKLPNAAWIINKLAMLAKEKGGAGDVPFPAAAQPQRRARGGLIYASNGTLVDFQPRGTDTVPAMLTPGEFVVNRAATQKHLPLLKTLNMNRGGKVQYRQNGGSMYDPATGAFSQTENLSQKILGVVQNSSGVINSSYADINSNLSISRRTNNIAGKTLDNTTALQQSVRNATGYASGGTVYANNGQLINFKPKGTDTVPAMLTPGEFVVNKEASQKYFSLLQAINSNNYANDSLLTMNRGGYIQPSYLRNGTPGIGSLPDITSMIGNSIKSAIEQVMSQVSRNQPQTNGVSTNTDLSKIKSFSDSINQLADKLFKLAIPPEISITGGTEVKVVGNLGLDALNSLNPQIAQMVIDRIKLAFDQLSRQNPGTLDFDIDFKGLK